MNFKVLSLISLLFINSAFAQSIPFPGPGGVGSGTPPVITTPVSLGCQVGPANNQTSTTLTTLAAIPAGSLVVLGIFVPFGTAQTVTSVGDGTNTYTQAAHNPWDGTNGSIYDLWYKENASAVSSSAALKANYSSGSSASASNPPVICGAYTTGVITSSSLDKAVASETNNGTAYSSTSTGVLTQANEIAFALMGYFNASATVTEGTGFTNINSGVQGSANWFAARLAYKITAATTALNYQPSTNVATFGGIALGTYKGF